MLVGYSKPWKFIPSEPGLIMERKPLLSPVIVLKRYKLNYSFYRFFYFLYFPLLSFYLHISIYLRCALYPFFYSTLCDKYLSVLAEDCDSLGSCSFRRYSLCNFCFSFVYKCEPFSRFSLFSQVVATFKSRFFSITSKFYYWTDVSPYIYYRSPYSHEFFFCSSYWLSTPALLASSLSYPFLATKVLVGMAQANLFPKCLCKTFGSEKIPYAAVGVECFLTFLSSVLFSFGKFAHHQAFNVGMLAAYICYISQCYGFIIFRYLLCSLLKLSLVYYYYFTTYSSVYMVEHV